MRDTARGAKTNSQVTFSHRHLHTDVQVSHDQLELIFNSSVLTQDVAWWTCRKRWMIETDGEREGNPCQQYDMMMMIRV